MSTNRRGKTTNKEDGLVVNMLKQSQGDASGNLGIKLSKLNQGVLSKDPGIESSMSNQGNSARANSSGANQDQGDLVTIGAGINQSQSQSQGAPIKELEKLPTNESLNKEDNWESLSSINKSNGSKEKDKRRDKSLVNPDYLSILGDVPTQEKHGITISINSDEEEGFDASVDLTNKDSVFAKAMELSVTGDGLGAAKYLNI
ncbi:uncharacterized protein MELLADRAFT_103662 [Melampsora larici-populina 98AG31]|uniref:Uncharacterized protein n=1 Tax=Melampsora larici-populina (strain 98AG31 / pathotype 3-4-7) TaxID=747676 RepID=F4RC25_MELLP|nr:uncharacterized protein MELLADRAFT_103662 [Melampsora larici-populina 98AG31]EGG10236.1 hypothetical protein MELLADRAFT_103662 [Melampsora larici-populina 98AG31]